MRAYWANRLFGRMLRGDFSAGSPPPRSNRRLSEEASPSFLPHLSIWFLNVKFYYTAGSVDCQDEKRKEKEKAQARPRACSRHPLVTFSPAGRYWI